MSDGRPSEPTRRDDENAMLALIPLAKEIADFCRSRLPEGQHFGVIIPVRVADKEVRIIALTSDREQIAPYAARWALDVHQNPSSEIDT
jgi:hypothetical protein